MEIIEKQIEIIERSMESARRWRTFSICLMVVVIFLLASLTTSVIYYEHMFTPIKEEKSTQKFRKSFQSSEESENPSVFRDLTKHEFKVLRAYLFGNNSLFNLVRNGRPTLDRSFLFSMELNLPEKSQTIAYLDDEGITPTREAKVVLFRGDKSPPVVEEYIIGPLPNISYHRLFVSKHYQKPAPYLFRPHSRSEHTDVLRLLREVDRVLKPLLEESFDASFFDCEPQCLVMNHWTPMSPAVSGKDIRRLWYWAHHSVEYYMLNPVDFFILFDLDGSDSSKYRVEAIWYGGQAFDTPQQLLDAYNSEKVTKTSIPFPTLSNDLISTLNLRGDPVPMENKRMPINVEPDGQRYNIRDRYVEYMDWQLNFRMSTTTGPQLFDVRFKKRRIIYELSLQEISVFHSGYKPWNRFADMIFSGSLIGYNAKTLIPGIDCPVTSTFVGTTHWVDGHAHPISFERTFCIFEHNTHIPLRRHHSFSKTDGTFYNNLHDIVLTLRTILVLSNYDYVVDFLFHQNGVLQVRTVSTGFIMPMIYSPQEGRYGFQLNEHVIGNVNHHSINFKVDVDINGVKNRFESLNIEAHSISNNDVSAERKSHYEQLKFSRDMQMTELQAVYRKNLSSPKYHIFYNKNYKTTYSDPRAYRILIDGGKSHLLSENIGNEGSISWARYQMAVTKRKEDESQSSSIYAMWDTKEPMVKFQSYLDDNDGIIDTDLVAWITLGINHLPQMEDFPLMTSTGNHQSFYIMPFNFFDEDPSMNSRDALRISVNKKTGFDIKMDYYGLPKDFVCNSDYHGEISNLFTNISTIFEQ